MANNLTTSFTHDYNGKERLELFQNYYKDDNYSSLYTFFGDVKSKLNLYLDESLAKIVRADSGCSASTAGTSALGDRTLEVFDVLGYTEQCAREFDATAWENTLGNGNAYYEMGGTVLGSYLANKFMTSIFTDNNRIDWFGNTASGTNANYIPYDGFFKFLTDRAIVPSGQYISLDDSTYQTSGELASDAALTLFKNITSVDKTDITLRKLPKAEKTIHVTGELFDNYLATLENQGNAQGQVNLENGIETVTFRGIRVVRRDDWDNWLTDTDNPFKSTLNDESTTYGHVCLYTTVKNLVVGSDIGASDEQMEMWFEKKDRKVYTRSAYKRGTTYLHSALASIAY